MSNMMAMFAYRAAALRDWFPKRTTPWAQGLPESPLRLPLLGVAAWSAGRRAAPWWPGGGGPSGQCPRGGCGGTEPYHVNHDHQFDQCETFLQQRHIVASR